MVEFLILTIGVLKLSNSLIHKEKKIVPRGTIFFLSLLGEGCSPWNSYLPNFISSTFTSAGETPGIRDA